MKKQKGVSLIEILIALIILATGVVTLMKLQGDLIRGRGLTGQQSQALMIMQNKIDELRNYQVLTTTTGYTAYDDIVSGSSVVTGDTTNYNLAWTVTDQTNPDRKEVQITATWTDASNATQTLTLDTMIGRVDPTVSGVLMQALP